MKHYTHPTFGDFTCCYCRQYVTAQAAFSGVQNRNHCPVCLYSRHLDLYRAGDRLAACKAPMRPIALTLKRSPKKYGSDRHGELMIVHRCQDCGVFSINRAAADDCADSLFAVFRASLTLSAEILAALHQQSIQILTAADEDALHARLFGCQSLRIPDWALS